MRLPQRPSHAQPPETLPFSHGTPRPPPPLVPATIHPTLFALSGAPPLTHRQRRDFLFLSFSVDPFSLADPPPPCQKQCLPQLSANCSALLLDRCLDPELVIKKETLLKTHTHAHTYWPKMWVCLIIPWLWLCSYFCSGYVTSSCMEYEGCGSQWVSHGGELSSGYLPPGR